MMRVRVGVRVRISARARDRQSEFVFGILSSRGRKGCYRIRAPAIYTCTGVTFKS